MKKIYLAALVLFATVFSANAQFTDDIEGYGNGPLFTPQWTTWDGNNDGTQNAIVSQDQALSGIKSVFIGPSSGGQDAILDFQGAAPGGSGIWTVEWKMYIPSGNSGYFNIQGNTSPDANANQQFLSGDIYFNQTGNNPGEGSDANSNGTNTFTFPHDEWFSVSVECDTDNETYVLKVAGTALPSVAYNAASDGFGGVDFFAAEAATTYYLDDVRLVQGVLSNEDFSEAVFNVYPNPVKDKLTIESAAAVNSIVVYDVLGKKVLSAQPDTISPSIDMSGLSSGAYLVQVTIGNASKTIKVLK